MKKILSINNFTHFSISYVITEAITLGLYIVVLFSLSPIVFGTIIEYNEKNSAYYAPGQDPLDIALYFLLFLLFYVVFSISYLYRDTERRLAYFKTTIKDHQPIQRTKYYMVEYGLADILYYFVVSIPVRIILRDTIESSILFWDMPVLLYHVLSWLLFAIMYVCCVMIVTGIWEKKRPEYLTKNYEEKANEI